MTGTPGAGQTNFVFLADHSPLLAELGATAERLFPFDPASCVLKLRLLAEALMQDVASRIGLHLQQPTQAELLRADSAPVTTTTSHGVQEEVARSNPATLDDKINGLAKKRASPFFFQGLVG